MEGTGSIKYNGFTTKSGNHIWAAALGLAWNELIDQFIKEPVKVKTEDAETLKII